MSERARDRAWLEGLFDRHAQAVRAYAQRRVPSDETDDVVSEVFSTAWQARARVPDDALPWLYRVAANHILHVHRSTARRGRLVPRVSGRAGEDGAAAFDDVVESVDAVRVVARLLSELSEADAEVLRLWAWERLGPTDMAVVLDCTVGTARGRLFRARRRAARLLSPASTGIPASTPTPAPTGPHAHSLHVAKEMS